MLQKPWYHPDFSIDHRLVRRETVNVSYFLNLLKQTSKMYLPEWECARTFQRHTGMIICYSAVKARRLMGEFGRTLVDLHISYFIFWIWQ